ncbi:MAG TPA: hypothetical protein VGG69_04785 [Rhizomicrobium sp.]
MSPLPLEDWRDFYVMIGTASGAIVGASFIVASLASSVKERSVGMRGFISPTAVHLASVLVSSAILSVPKISPLVVAVLLGAGGAAGAIYALIVVARIWRMKLGVEDWCFYALLPVFAYGAIAAAAGMIVLRTDSPLYVLAAALILLLILGMRNAWDMATFLIMRERE